MSITNEQVENYIKAIIPAWTSDATIGNVFAGQEAEAMRDGVPILNKTSVAYLRWLVQLRQPKRMLEIGTAIGYSGLHLLQASPTATLITLELDSERAAHARAYFEAAGVNERVTIVEGDANETLDTLRDLEAFGDGFDFVFIDAAKGAYATFFEKAIAMSVSGALLVSDNILFRGLVAEEPTAVHRRHRGMVQKIKSYNEMLIQDERLNTVIVPIGDGFALSVLKEAGSK
jgi:caffeoyl-CoA O-methyltransferase